TAQNTKAHNCFAPQWVAECTGDDVLIEKQISRSTKEFYFKRRKMTTSSSWFRHVADTQTT
ncbi:MAG TPA: hypothetical protein VI386_12625, partial [Candidatus Sulfotelmatobacter sp.]